MATNYVQDGEVLDLIAPAALSSGDPFQVGQIVAIAQADAASGAAVQGVRRGVFTVPKTSAQAWTVGALIYFDSSAGAFTTVSTDNTLCGVAVAVAANPSPTGSVLLDGAAR